MIDRTPPSRWCRAKRYAGSWPRSAGARRARGGASRPTMCSRPSSPSWTTSAGPSWTRRCGRRTPRSRTGRRRCVRSSGRWVQTDSRSPFFRYRLLMPGPAGLGPLMVDPKEANMSDEALRDLVAHMATDPAFAEQVRADPAGVAAAHGLTVEQVVSLGQLGDGSGSAGPSMLDARLSKSSLFFGGGLHVDP